MVLCIIGFILFLSSVQPAMSIMTRPSFSFIRRKFTSCHEKSSLDSLYSKKCLSYSIPSRYNEKIIPLDEIRGGFLLDKSVGDSYIPQTLASAKTEPIRRGLSRRDLRSVSNTTSRVAYSTGASCGYSPSVSRAPPTGGG